MKINSIHSEEHAAKLSVHSQGRPEFEVKLGDILSIGRSVSNQLVLDDTKVSRHHAEILHAAGGQYRLIDLGSVNGTWLNSQRITGPKNLRDGDLIEIGTTELRFTTSRITQLHNITTAPGTIQSMRNVQVVVLVADIRNFTTMSEALPKDEFSRWIATWFQESSYTIEKNNGTIDKFIGDAVMAYWIAANALEPGEEVNAALRTVLELISRAKSFSARLSAQFPGYSFRIGIGLNLGNAVLGNVGTGKIQSFTVVGDSVNVAFRLEALTKEKGSAVLSSRSIADHASSQFRFRDLGEVTIKGRKNPVLISALELPPDL